MNKEQLKGCPFCGSLHLQFGTRERSATQSYLRLVQCMRCRIDFEFWQTMDTRSTEDDLKRLWNTRPEPPAATPEPLLDETLACSCVSGWTCNNCGHPRHPRERCAHEAVYKTHLLEDQYRWHCPCGIAHETAHRR